MVLVIILFLFFATILDQIKMSIFKIAGFNDNCLPLKESVVKIRLPTRLKEKELRILDALLLLIANSVRLPGWAYH